MDSGPNAEEVCNRGADEDSECAATTGLLAEIDFSVPEIVGCAIAVCGRNWHQYGEQHEQEGDKKSHLGGMSGMSLESLVIMQVENEGLEGMRVVKARKEGKDRIVRMLDR